MRSSKEIIALQKALLKLENLHASFDYLKISIASPIKIKSWAERKLPSGEMVGQVLKPETINFRTNQPEEYGLFCQKIFGPIKSWRCKCGTYNGFALDKVCEDCNVEITEARVRRYRMGYIELTCPIAHHWYLKGVPNYLTTLLKCVDEDLKLSDIEDIIYFKEGSQIIEPSNPLYKYYESDSKIKNGIFLNKEEKLFSGILNRSSKQKRKGAEIIKAALEDLNLKEEISFARQQFEMSIARDAALSDKKTMKRIRILESFLATKTNPSWMILINLPVLPPNLRPLVELENGRLVAADVNELYRLILTRNQRLSDFLYEFMTPDLISVQGRKLLQDIIDCLIDNSRLPKNKIFSLNNKALKSLTEILEGKQGRFRQSLLGKRVDYSGRSVIIVGPNLRLNQCGLPYEMAAELFQPFLVNQLLQTKIKPPSYNIKLARIIIKKKKPFIWALLEILTRKHSILLNRAPTLHRFGIQAFDPLIILGQAIHLHPLVCGGFNADFDGDQMAVHLPLYEASQLEIKTLMRPSYNVLSPSNGEVILKPTQDMVIGSYYLTLMLVNDEVFSKNWFPNQNDALLAFYQKKISIHTPIFIRYSKNIKVLFTMRNNQIIFSPGLFSIGEKTVQIYKTIETGNKVKKFYFLANIGIVTARQFETDKYELTDLFLETTPGRLIFAMNLNISMNLETL